VVTSVVEQYPVTFEERMRSRQRTRLGQAMRLLEFFGACILFVACGAPCGDNEKIGEWTYVQERDWTARGPVCVSRLKFRGGDVWAGRHVITPLGTFRLVLSEHGGEDNGWQRIAAETSDDVPVDSSLAKVTAERLRMGFYASPATKKLPGTPKEWVYVGGVTEPGWVAPEKLRDLEFIRQHPPVVATGS
jgi:hypothetical protein